MWNALKCCAVHNLGLSVGPFGPKLLREWLRAAQDLGASAAVFHARIITPPQSSKISPNSDEPASGHDRPPILLPPASKGQAGPEEWQLHLHANIATKHLYNHKYNCNNTFFLVFCAGVV